MPLIKVSEVFCIPNGIVLVMKEFAERRGRNRRDCSLVERLANRGRSGHLLHTKVQRAVRVDGSRLFEEGLDAISDNTRRYGQPRAGQFPSLCSFQGLRGDRLRGFNKIASSVFMKNGSGGASSLAEHMPRDSKSLERLKCYPHLVIVTPNPRPLVLASPRAAQRLHPQHRPPRHRIQAFLPAALQITVFPSQGAPPPHTSRTRLILSTPMLTGFAKCTVAGFCSP